MNLLLRHGSGDRPLLDAGTDKAPRTGGPPRIRCPRCAWEPGRGDRWTCACLHIWNTFETAGVCPACQRQWLETQCPRCSGWSPHQAWYVDDDDGDH